MKHPQHIVAVPASLVSNRVRGWANVTIKGTDLVIACRSHLEENENFRQIIPVSVLVKGESIWCYVRGKDGGEAKLHGKLACALGGHWDLADLVCDENSVIDYEKSISAAALRELSEEILITGSITHACSHEHVLSVDDTPVDRVHLAQITFFFLSDDTTVESKETALIPVGFVSSSDLELQYNGKTEAWTNYIFEALKVLNTTQLKVETNDGAV